MKNKEEKFKAIFKFKNMSILDKNEKKKLRKIAEKLVTDVDLSDIF